MEILQYLKLASLTAATYEHFQQMVFYVIYQVSIKNEYERYNRKWRLDPLDVIKDNMPNYVFKRLYRVSKDLFLILYDGMISEYNRIYVHNGSSRGGRPRIPFSLRLGCYLFYIGRDTDLFTSAWMFGVGESSIKNIIKEFIYLIPFCFPNTITFKI